MNDPKQTPDTNQLGVQLEKLTFLPERKSTYKKTCRFNKYF